MDIQSVGVLGCGLMGAGIAQVVAAAGYKTVVLEVNQATLAAGFARAEKFFADRVAKGKISSEAGANALNRMSGASNPSDLADCDLIIEAIIENLDAKRAAYASVEAVIKKETIIASNTSSLPIMELAAGTHRPDRFGGLHFFNPVPVMKLVEIVRALSTSDDTHETLMGFARTLGKEPIAAPDRPGFVVNRLLVPYLLDAIREYERGLGTIEDIDNGMKLGCGHPMGPFELLDFVGLDTAYYAANIMFDEFHEPQFSPPPLLKRMVLAGYLGRKAKRGFYSY